MFRRGKSKMLGKSVKSNSERATSSSSTGNRVSKALRRTTAPASYRRVSGIMKFVTADESNHSTYGESSNKTSGSSSPDESKQNNNNRRRLQFDAIEIREYGRTVGDNPSCSSGPPISISWDYNPQTQILSIDEYEDNRGDRRTHFEMVLPRSVRNDMLRKEWDVSQSQIAAAVRQNIKIKNQRRATVNNLSKTGTEEVLEKAGRKLFQTLLLKKSTAQQVAQLERQYQLAEAQRRQAEFNEYMSGDEQLEVEDDDDEDHQDKPPPPIVCQEEEEDQQVDEEKQADTYDDRQEGHPQQEEEEKKQEQQEEAGLLSLTAGQPTSEAHVSSCTRLDV